MKRILTFAVELPNTMNVVSMRKMTKRMAQEVEASHGEVINSRNSPDPRDIQNEH